MGRKPGVGDYMGGYLKFRVSPEMKTRIDKVRGKLSISKWIRRAVEDRLDFEERRAKDALL